MVMNTGAAMNDQPPTQDEKALRLLRRLVTVLTAVMIIGIVTITVLLAIRLNQPVAQTTPDPIPETLALPEDTEILFSRRMAGNITVVTEDMTLIVLNPEGTEVLYIITPEMAEALLQSLPEE